MLLVETHKEVYVCTYTLPLLKRLFWCPIVIL